VSERKLFWARSARVFLVPDLANVWQRR